MTTITRRSLGALAASAAVAGQARAAGPSAMADDQVLAFVHPEYRAIARRLMQRTARPLDRASLPAMRRSQPVFSPSTSPAWFERRVPGAPGAPDVRVYVINEKPNATPRAAILHMHGGGFVAGEAKGSIRTAQELARALDCLIVTVDYRLAPETRFPGALEDNYAALKWLHSEAAQLGVDPQRIAVMGDSAGGGHAAMLAIAARDRGEVPLIYQALIYPMLDDRTGSTRRTPPHQGRLIWTAENNRFGWTSLLGVPAGSRRVPKGAVPAREENLAGLPPAFVGVGSIDLFVDEDITYARRLIEAGIPVTLEVAPGAFHGFDILPGRLGQQFKGSLISALADALQPGAWTPAR